MLRIISHTLRVHRSSLDTALARDSCWNSLVMSTIARHCRGNVNANLTGPRLYRGLNSPEGLES